MTLRISLLAKAVVGAGLFLQCSPDFDKLSSGEPGSGGSAAGGASAGGSVANGDSGSASVEGGMGQTGGEAPTTGGRGSGGAIGSAGAPAGGADNTAGAAGSPAGGTTGSGGRDGDPQGGKVTSAGSGGEGGAPPDPSIPPPSTTCEDGCATLYVPFSNGAEQQFFTILLGDVDLSQAIVTAKVRVTKFGSSTGYMKLYAGSIDNFDYYGGPNITYIIEGDEKVLALDLTGTPKNLSGKDWNNKRVAHIGIQINSQSGAKYGGLFLEVEDIRVSNDAIPAYTFTTMTSINALGVNPYQAVEGSAVTWTPPVATE